MYNLLITKDLRIDLNEEPDCDTRPTLPEDTDDEVNDKQAKPFILKNALSVDGVYYSKDLYGRDNPFVFHFNIAKDFTWDGATIPRLLWFIIGGKGSPEFLIASLLHDAMCNNKYVMRHNRYLSSLILREVLIACHTAKWKAYTMFYTVDAWQRTQGW